MYKLKCHCGMNDEGSSGEGSIRERPNRVERWKSSCWVIIERDEYFLMSILNYKKHIVRCSKKRTKDKYMLSGYELIDTENISLPSHNMKFVGMWATRTGHKLHILSNRLIYFSINHIHIQMICLSSLNQT